MITNAQLIAANRQALTDGTLAALTTRRCSYKDCCAIGCALDQTTIKEIVDTDRDHQGVDMLRLDFEDPNFASYLQQLHDAWCQRHRLPYNLRFREWMLRHDNIRYVTREVFEDFLEHHS